MKGGVRFGKKDKTGDSPAAAFKLVTPGSPQDLKSLIGKSRTQHVHELPAVAQFFWPYPEKIH
jgi:hypothetical protein